MSFLSLLRIHKYQEVLLTILLLGAVLFFGYISLKFPEPWDENIGPAVIPQTWIVLLSLAIILQLTCLFRQKKSTECKEKKTGKVITVILAVSALIYSMEYLGFYLPSFVFVALMPVYLKKFSFSLVPISAGWVTAIYLIFERLLGIELPKGVMF